MSNPPGSTNASAKPLVAPPGSLNSHTGVRTCPNTPNYDPDSSALRDPESQWLLSFFLFPPWGKQKNTPVYVCFSSYYLFSSSSPTHRSPSPLFSKESQPLALILSPLRLCGQDGGWWELTWWWLCPHRRVNVTPGMPSVYAGPNGTQCKVLHCGGRVGEARRAGGIWGETGYSGSQAERCKMERDASRMQKETSMADVLVIVVFRGWYTIHKRAVLYIIGPLIHWLVALSIIMLSMAACRRVNTGESLTSHICDATIERTCWLWL